MFSYLFQRRCGRKRGLPTLSFLCSSPTDGGDTQSCAGAAKPRSFGDAGDVGGADACPCFGAPRCSRGSCSEPERSPTQTCAHEGQQEDASASLSSRVFPCIRVAEEHRSHQRPRLQTQERCWCTQSFRSTKTHSNKHWRSCPPGRYLQAVLNQLLHLKP